MTPIIDHIHITVADLDRAVDFYDKFLPLLGYDIRQKETSCVPAHEYRIVEYHHKNLSIGLVNQRSAYRFETPSRRKAGALHHLAFQVGSPETVDTLFHQVLRIPATIVHPPKFYPEYCPDYYAFFFKDSEGTELEIVSFDRARYFPK